MARAIRILLCLSMLFTAALPETFAQKSKQFVLVIDPGHGGKHPGAIGKRGTRESDVNLKVSLSFGEMIKKKYPDIKIIYTRKNDSYLSLGERAAIANRAKADLFISVHSNASPNRQAHGCQTFTLGAGSSAEAKAAAKYENDEVYKEEGNKQSYASNSTESAILSDIIFGHDMKKSISCAEHIQKGMIKYSKLYNRGVASAGFWVLHQTEMPRILIELAFISNDKEERYLASKNGQQQLSKGIFEGFCNYYEEWKRTRINAGATVDEAVYTEEEPAYPEEEATLPKSDTKQQQVAQTVEAKEEKGDAPVFKIQILTSSTKLKSNDKRFKGKKVDFYKEGGVYKYTIGSSTDYNAIVRKSKELRKEFKGAFIVAFKNGKRIDTQKAIKEFQSKK